MANIRIKKKVNNFVQIDNTGIRDDRLTWNATGLLTYLISLPTDWEANISHLSTVKKCGRDKTNNSLKELRKYDYVHYFEIKRNGRIEANTYLVFEVPTDQNEAMELIELEDNQTIRYKPVSTGKTKATPKTGFPKTEILKAENRELLIKDSKKKDFTKNYLKEKPNQSVDKSSLGKTKKPFVFHKYKFLADMEDISLKTRINIELNLKDMKLTKEFVLENLEYIKNDKKIKDIEATLYSSLKKCIRYNATNFARAKEQESINNKKNDTVNKDIINTIVETPKVNLRQNIIMKHMKLNKMKLGVKALRQLNIELKENNLEMHELS